MKPSQGEGGSHLCLQAKAQKHDRLGQALPASLSTYLSLSNTYMLGSGKPGTRMTLSG